MTTSAPTTILRVDKPRLRVIGEPIPTPRRPPNEQLRPREFLTAQEVNGLIPTAKKRGRYGQRDATAILICYRHVRVSELCGLTWDRVDFQSADLVVNAPRAASRPCTR